MYRPAKNMKTVASSMILTIHGSAISETALWSRGGGNSLHQLAI
jgi:hypothetical protein